MTRRLDEQGLRIGPPMPSYIGKYPVCDCSDEHDPFGPLRVFRAACHLMFGIGIGVLVQFVWRIMQ